MSFQLDFAWRSKYRRFISSQGERSHILAAWTRAVPHGAGGRRALFDARVAFLLTDDAYERVVAKAVGIPRREQTVLVELIATSALATTLATVLGGYAARLPSIRPSGVDLAIGGSVLNSALRGIAGAPAQTCPPPAC